MQSAKCKIIEKRRIFKLQAGSIGLESVLCKPGMFLLLGFNLGALVWGLLPPFLNLFLLIV